MSSQNFTRRRLFQRGGCWRRPASSQRRALPPPGHHRTQHLRIDRRHAVCELPGTFTIITRLANAARSEARDGRSLAPLRPSGRADERRAASGWRN